MASASTKQQENIEFKSNQWQVQGGLFMPCGDTVDDLPPGVYQFIPPSLFFPGGLKLKDSFIVDNLIELPGSVGANVIRNIRKFWQSAEQYKKFGVVHKRGVLLYGTPGTGKTATLSTLARELVKLGGIVLINDDIRHLTSALTVIRKLEPERPIVVIVEDLDQQIAHRGEEQFLSLLDGENQIANVCYLATTNYIEQLSARLVKRPSRFDEVLELGMPTAAQRRFYLDQVSQGAISPGGLDKMVADTEGYSIAFLKELLIANVVLSVPYDEALARLNTMIERKVEGIDPNDAEDKRILAKLKEDYGWVISDAKEDLAREALGAGN